MSESYENKCRTGNMKGRKFEFATEQMLEHYEKKHMGHQPFPDAIKISACGMVNFQPVWGDYLDKRMQCDYVSLRKWPDGPWEKREFEKIREDIKHINELHLKEHQRIYEELKKADPNLQEISLEDNFHKYKLSEYKKIISANRGSDYTVQ